MNDKFIFIYTIDRISDVIQLFENVSYLIIDTNNHLSSG